MFDQIVLKTGVNRTTAPGAQNKDATIVPR
jgi:hypothetical protein